MSARKVAKKVELLIPDRPICLGCGELKATHRVSLYVDELQVETETRPGVGHVVRWSPQAMQGTFVQTTMCRECVKQHVKIGLTVEASVMEKRG